MRAEVQRVKDAGFPIDLQERTGTHYDDDNATHTTGMFADIRNILLPHMADGWQAPAAPGAAGAELLTVLS